MAAAVELVDLRPAAEAVGEYDGRLVLRPQPRQQHPLRARLADVQVAALEAEVAGQSAAAGVQPLGVHPGPAQQFPVGLPAHDRVLVAVHLRQRLRGPVGHPRRLVAGGVLGEQFRQRHRLLAQPAHVLVAGEHLRRVRPEHGRAARLQRHHQTARPHVLRQSAHCPGEHLLRHPELTGGDPGQPAAQRLGRQFHPPAGVLQHPYRRPSDVRMEMVGEGVRPQQHCPAPPVAERLVAGEPPLEGLLREERHLAVRHPRHQHGGLRQQRSVRERVDHRREAGAPHGLGERGQPAHRPVGARPAPRPPLVVVGQELRLVRGHVHVRRTVLLASLAGQTEIEGVLDRLRAPAVLDRAVPVPVEHLEQQPGPAPGGVLLLPCHLVRRTHDRAFSGVLPALSDAHAPIGGLGERPAVVREAETQVAGLVRGPVAAQAQVLVQPVRRDDLPRVHPVQRVEDGLQPPERLGQLVPEHPRQQLAPALPVPVLAGQRPAELHDEIGRPLHEPPVRSHPVRGVQVEGDPGVHTALPEVPVQTGSGVAQVAELLEERAQPPQVVAQLLGGDRRVLPALEGVGLARDVRGGTEPGLPDLPQRLLVRRVVEERAVRVVLGAVHRLQHPVRPRARLLDGVAAELRQQVGVAVGQLGERLVVEALDPLVPDQPCVHALQRDRFVRQDVGHGVGGLVDDVEPEHHQHPFLHHRHQFQLRPQDGDQRGFAAHQQPGDVEAVLGQQRVQVVAGHPARDFREPAADLVPVCVAQRAQPPVDGRPQVALPLDPGVLLVAGLPAPEAGPVVEQHLQPGDVVDDLAVRLRGGAAGVVADHAADGAVGVGGGLGPVAQPVRRELPVEVVQHDPRLHDAGAGIGVHRLHTGAVLRPVEHHPRVGALSRQARPAAPRQNRRTELPRHGHRLGTGLGGARDDHADGRLPEVRGVRGVRRPAPGVEADLTVDPLAQCGLERDGVDRRRRPFASDGFGQVQRTHGLSFGCRHGYGARACGAAVAEYPGGRGGNHRTRSVANRVAVGPNG